MENHDPVFVFGILPRLATACLRYEFHIFSVCTSGMVYERVFCCCCWTANRLSRVNRFKQFIIFGGWRELIVLNVYATYYFFLYEIFASRQWLAGCGSFGCFNSLATTISTTIFRYEFPHLPANQKKTLFDRIHSKLNHTKCTSHFHETG